MTNPKRRFIVSGLVALAGVEIGYRLSKGQGTKKPWLNGLIAGFSLVAIVFQAHDLCDTLEKLEENQKIK